MKSLLQLLATMYRRRKAGLFTALLLALLLVCLVAPWIILRASRTSGAALQQSAAELRVAMLDAVEGHTDMVLMQATSPMQTEFDALCKRAASAKEKQAAIAAGGQWQLVAISGLSVVAILWFGLGALEEGHVSGPLLAGLLLAALGLFEVAGPIMRGAARMGAAIQGAARIQEVASASADLLDPAVPVALPSEGIIVLDTLSFSYEGLAAAAVPVLRDVNLRVEIGERIAIVGPSGAGKSTLLHLLLRLEDPVAGSVNFGGCDVRLCAQAQLHQRIALLSQDAPVFLGTLRSNVLIGNPDADEAAVWEALELVRLADFVRALPDGLDTWTGETGANLSVGQARRLCLARALVSPAAVLVLDEPTSGLDAEAEKAFFTDLARAAGRRSVILATHASLPEGAVHRVYRLSKGRLQAV